ALDGGTDNNRLDEDKGVGITSNGIVVDLDRESSAEYRGQHPSQILSAVYRLDNDHGALKESLSVTDAYVIGGGSSDIVVEGVTIGQLDYPLGLPYVVYTTDPGGPPERPIPADFPEIHAGAKVRVGIYRLSKMRSVYETWPQEPKAPKKLV